MFDKCKISNEFKHRDLCIFVGSSFYARRPFDQYLNKQGQEGFILIYERSQCIACMYADWFWEFRKTYGNLRKSMTMSYHSKIIDVFNIIIILLMCSKKTE